MSASIRSSKASPSRAVRARLDYPVIDTDVHTNTESNADFFKGTAIEALVKAAPAVAAAE